MNERINELFGRALDEAVPETWTTLNPAQLSRLKEKFAELIVRECVAQIEIEKGNPYRNMGDENRYGIGACVESIRRIKEHFGVEE
jgi:hypothetical protein